jgi:anaerobic selenocysteine-containing dehydrogenase
MERRQFIILTAAGAAGSLALEGCTTQSEYSEPLYVVNEKYIPGADYWHATVCGQCQAGCGVIVRQRDGNANKIEGNPLHPISRGKLCARGQAGLNELYNPDRIKHPLKLNGVRGSGNFQEITWDSAIETLTERLRDLRQRGQAKQIVWIEGSESRGTFRDLAERFLSALGGPVMTSFMPFSRDVERESARTTFGSSAPPTYDLSQADFVLSFGARFLETWSSPVYYSRGFGEMRRARKTRGRFVHAEPRLSLTAASADEWLPVRPGAEGRLALSIAHELIRGSSRSFPGFDSFDPEATHESTGIGAATVRRIARELNESQHVVVLGGDGAAAHTSGSFNLEAINYLGSIVNGGSGSRYVVRTDTGDSRKQMPLADIVKDAQLIMVHGANPVFQSPAAFKIADALAKVPFVVSFSSFEDETSVLADLILPDHTSLERWDDDLPQEGVTGPIVSFSQPVVAPLYQTRQTGDVLLAVAAKIPEISAGFKAESFKSLIEERHFKKAGEREPGWEQALQRGGIWPEETEPGKARQERVVVPPGQEEQAQFAGDEHEYPFHFLPYEHLFLGVGDTANQPLLQSLPDPLTAVSWGSWVEVNPEMAARHGINYGDLLSVESPHGRIEAPAIIYPGIRPDVIAMPCGQGHERYGRYASDRGANPLRILAPLTESNTGALAWAATRVRITKLNQESRMVTSGTNERLLEDRRDLKR